MQSRNCRGADVHASAVLSLWRAFRARAPELAQCRLVVEQTPDRRGQLPHRALFSL